MSIPPDTPTDCPLCPQNNLLKVPIIAETDEAYLIEASNNKGCYLIIPTAHAEAPGDMPDTWWGSVKELIPHVPNSPEHYNLSLNIGKPAGQTLKHLHFWIIPRESGKPSSGMGMALLISRANQE